MQLALCGISALAALRAARQGLTGKNGVPKERELLLPPDPGPERKRFTPKLLADVSVGSWHVPQGSMLEVAVLDQLERLQSKGITCKVFSQPAMQRAFVSLGEGVQASSPELLFIEMAQVMPLMNLVLLGCELCGSFSRDPADPHDGDVAYWVDPVTSVEKIRTFAKLCTHVRGITRAAKALSYVMDNAWSPTEALVAVMAALPLEYGGYGIDPVVLNKRVPVSEKATRASRVPDMLFANGMVGLNYDGEDHFDLGKVVSAAQRLREYAGEDSSQRQLSAALEDVREKYVDDRRRDRELAAAGRLVFSVTKEDLIEKGGLDNLMTLVLDALDRGASEKFKMTRAAMRVRELARMRQDLLWSAMPGARGVQARRRLARRAARRRSELEVLRASLQDEDAWEHIELV
jgi:hypothetical protein